MRFVTLLKRFLSIPIAAHPGSREFLHFAVHRGIDLLIPFLQFLRQAQTSRYAGAIEGRIVDSSGAIVPDAIIAVRNTRTGQSRTVRSGPDRNFPLPRNSLPGTYEVRVDHPGFATSRITELELALGSDNSPGNRSISGVQRHGNRRQNQSQSLPTSRKPPLFPPSIRSASKNCPSIVETIWILFFSLREFYPPRFLQAPQAAQPSYPRGFTFGGLRSRSNNISIDGLDNNDEFTGSSRIELSPEIVQEFQVVNTGLSRRIRRRFRRLHQCDHSLRHEHDSR